jgi:hypothetical protein
MAVAALSPFQVAKNLRKNKRLTVRQHHGHYKVYEKRTGAWLFDFSGSPSDMNWHRMLRRQLRAWGLHWINIEGRTSRSISKGVGPQLDTEALARAQQSAIAAGMEPPRLEDFLDSWQPKATATGYRDQDIERVIDGMNADETAPRYVRTRERVGSVIERYGDRLVEDKRKAKVEQGIIGGRVSARAEFVHHAFEVAEKRDMWCWPSNSAGVDSVRRFVDDKTEVSIAAMNLMEATCDVIESLYQWGKDEEPPEATEEAAETGAVPGPDLVAVEPGEGEESQTEPLSEEQAARQHPSFGTIINKLDEDLEAAQSLLDEQAAAIELLRSELKEAQRLQRQAEKQAEKLESELARAGEDLVEQYAPLEAAAFNGDLRSEYGHMLMETFQKLAVEGTLSDLDPILERLDKLAGIQ